MADSYEYDEENTTDKSALIGLPSSDVPPAYSEGDSELPGSAGTQPPNLQPPGQPYEMGQYPQQVQVGGALPQIWTQGSPVSSTDCIKSLTCGC